jgi:hypothetical protein
LGKFWFNIFAILFAISRGDYFKSRVSKREIFVDKSPKSGFLGGAREKSFSG